MSFNKSLQVTSRLVRSKIWDNLPLLNFSSWKNLRFIDFVCLSFREQFYKAYPQQKFLLSRFVSLAEKKHQQKISRISLSIDSLKYFWLHGYMFGPILRNVKQVKINPFLIIINVWSLQQKINQNKIKLIKILVKLGATCNFRGVNIFQGWFLKNFIHLFWKIMHAQLFDQSHHSRV